jgi:AraC-like DNA-binding protein
MQGEAERALRCRSPSTWRARVASAAGPRSLQRRLHEHGTSFEIELDALRVEIAQRLMLRTEASLTEISLAVGCASPGHFGVLFRKATGMSPRRWRVEQLARRRKSTD